MILPNIPDDATDQQVKEIMVNFVDNIKMSITPMLEKIEIDKQTQVDSTGNLKTQLLRTDSGGGGDLITQDNEPVYLSLILQNGGYMSVENKQLKNLRNRTITFLKETTPETLVRVAIFLKLKVPDEKRYQYIKCTEKYSSTLGAKLQKIKYWKDYFLFKQYYLTHKRYE